MSYLSEETQTKWKSIIEHEDLEPIKDSHKRAVTAQLLENTENLFLFFPQGKIESIYTREFTFEKGLLSHILENTKNDFQLVFNVNLIHYGTNLRPNMCVYYETQQINANTNTEDVEKTFNRFATACFTKQGAK